MKTISIILRVILVISIILTVVFVPHYVMIMGQMINPNINGGVQDSSVESWFIGLLLLLTGGFIIIAFGCFIKILYYLFLESFFDNFINWLLGKSNKKSNNIIIKSK